MINKYFWRFKYDRRKYDYFLYRIMFFQFSGNPPPPRRITNNPPGHHGREGFVRLRDYPSISIFSPDFSSTVKWSSQTMIRSSQRFTSASSKVSRCAGCCLIKSCSSLMRAICAFLAAVSTVHFSRC